MMADFSDVPGGHAVGIQPHGLLVVLHGDDWMIGQISANAAGLIGREPQELLATPFLELVEPTVRTPVEAALRAAGREEGDSFRVPLLPPTSGTERVVFDAIARVLPGPILVVEMERDPAPDQGGSPSPGSDSALQLVRRCLAAVADLTRPDDIVGVIASEMRRFTEFDRVMVERVDNDFSSEVIAEERAQDIEPFLGLHLRPPASAGNAREYRPVHFIHDAAAHPVPFVPTLYPRNGAPPDLSRAVLRSPSPPKVRYLAALGVASVLTVPLVVEDRLWGWIVCQHRQPKYLSHEQRAAASLCGLVMAIQIEVKLRVMEDRRAAAAHESALRLLGGLKDVGDMVGSLRGALPSLVSLFAADGAALLSADGIHVSGSAPPQPRLVALREELQGKPLQGLCITERATEPFPLLVPSLPQAAGIVVIDLGEGSWLLLFRDEVIRRRQWARDPAEPLKAGSDEIVRGSSLPWPAVTPELVTEVRAGILDLVRHHAAGLARANEDLRRFAGVVAHEVKNQLQPGVLALSMLRSGIAGPLNPDFTPIVEMGNRALSGLVEFTAEMLEFAEAEMSLLLEEVDLKPLVEQVVRELCFGQADDSVRFEISNLPRIRGLRVQMHHVFANLLKNALLHARDASRPLVIQVGSRRDAEHGPVVFVRDNGRGIPAEEQQRLFDYFARGRDSRSPGSGIGLAYCAQVIQRHGQKLWVESTPGKGATFYFTVDIADGCRPLEVPS